ncbi:ankyrin repeat domain-containing protein [Aquimarina megaterium]|uniref:ankyrin repeat domain-containing protein n=1 Tax=Aquimarina megaterium TaxID=1443666 RepID=UPI00094589D0|nr:ankyrin repeat domain-containing protein [Aquimarina megaterium]
MTEFNSLDISDINQIKERIAQGIDINITDSYGETMLHKATYYEEIDVVKLLIEEGININAVNSNGATALIKASDRSEEISQYLIENGADVTSKEGKEYDGCSALHYAARKGLRNLVKLLLLNGAKVDEFSNNKETPFNEAIHFNQIECADILLANGANIDNRYDSMYHKDIGSLHFAINGGYVYSKNLAKYLITNNADVMLKNGEGISVLHLAAQDQNNVLTIQLLNAAPNINAVDANGKTIMHHAAFNRNISVLKKVLKTKEIDLNIKDNDGHPPLYYAENEKNAALIIAAGAIYDDSKKASELFMNLYSEYLNKEIITKELMKIK